VPGSNPDQPLQPGTPAERSLDAKVIDIAIRLGVIGLFIFFSLQLIAPFALFLLWALVLTVALYPAYVALAAWLGGRRILAATILTLVGLGIVIGPVAALVVSLADSLRHAYGLVSTGDVRLPPLPEQVAGLPLVGERVADFWQSAARNLEAALSQLAPYLIPAGSRILSVLAGLAGSVLFFAVSVLLAGFLFVPGPQLAAGARRFADRIIAPRGAELVDLAGATIRNVSRGVIGVAVIQGLLAGIVLALFGIPAAGLLAFAALFLCIVQIGPAPILLPVILWYWTAADAVTAAAFTALILPVMLVDNVLRPILMARGLDVPMLVILIGVLGGTLAYGLIGLFLGPVVLAVFYELVVAWVGIEGPRNEERSIADEP